MGNSSAASLGSFRDEGCEAKFLKAVFYLFLFVSCVSFTLEVQESAWFSLLFLLIKSALLAVYVLLSLVFSKHVDRYVLFVLIAGGLSFFSYEKVFPYSLFLILATAVSERSHKFIEDMFCRGAIVVFCVCLSVFFLSFVGLIESKTFVNTLGHAQEERNSLGFFNPNPASLLLLSVVLIFYLFERYFWFWVSFLAFCFFSVWLFSRTYVFIACLLPLFYFIRLCRLSVALNIVSVFIVLMIPLFVINFSEYRPIYVAGVDINSYLSNRLYVVSESFSAGGGVSLFPSSNFVTVDPGLINFLGGGGVLMYLMFSAVLIFALARRPGKKLSLLAFVFLLVNLSENIFSPYNLLSILFFVSILKKTYGCFRVTKEKNINSELLVGAWRH